MIQGFYLPVPYPLSRKFPSRAPHDSSAPHLTLMYGIQPENEAQSLELLGEVKDIVRGFTNLEITANSHGEFINEEGVLITYLHPEFGEGVAKLRGKIARACLDRGLDFYFSQQQWLPHITWSYGECPRPPVAVGTWVVPYVGVWYWGEPTSQKRISTRRG